MRFATVYATRFATGYATRFATACAKQAWESRFVYVLKHPS